MDVRAAVRVLAAARAEPAPQPAPQPVPESEPSTAVGELQWRQTSPGRYEAMRVEAAPSHIMRVIPRRQLSTADIKLPPLSIVDDDEEDRLRARIRTVLEPKPLSRKEPSPSEATSQGHTQLPRMDRMRPASYYEPVHEQPSVTKDDHAVLRLLDECEAEALMIGGDSTSAQLESLISDELSDWESTSVARLDDALRPDTPGPTKKLAAIATLRFKD